MSPEENQSPWEQDQWEQEQWQGQDQWGQQNQADNQEQHQEQQNQQANTADKINSGINRFACCAEDLKDSVINNLNLGLIDLIKEGLSNFNFNQIINLIKSDETMDITDTRNEYIKYIGSCWILLAISFILSYFSSFLLTNSLYIVYFRLYKTRGILKIVSGLFTSILAAFVALAIATCILILFIMVLNKIHKLSPMWVKILCVLSILNLVAIAFSLVIDVIDIFEWISVLGMIAGILSIVGNLLTAIVGLVVMGTLTNLKPLSENS
jgi:hypothetical protein